MSGKRGGGGVGKGNNGISSIPAGSRMIVQGLKEIVNCPETEIYTMLKDCNMDPNEAVNRLLSQDPFHEVKSKRDKRKESKDTTDSRPRGASNTSNRGSRGGTDHYGGRGGSAHFSSNESGPLHGEPAYKKENGTHVYAGSSSSASGMVPNNINRRALSHSDTVVIENKTSTVLTGDGISSSSQPSLGFQSAWLGGPGQVSMADIVKMGRPQNKAPPHRSVNNRDVVVPPSAASYHDLHSSQGHPKVAELSSEPEVATCQHASPNDEWPSIVQPPTVSSVLEGPTGSELYTDQSNLSIDRIEPRIKSQLDEVEEEEDSPDETPSTNNVGSACVSNRNIQEDNSGGSSLFKNNLYNNMSSYQPHRHVFEYEAQDGTSSVTEKLQQLSLQNDDRGAPAEEDNPTVIIPNHLQVHTPDCSHLSFGSFGSGIGSTFSAPFISRPLKNNLEETSETADLLSIGHSDIRNPECYGDEHLGSTSDANIAHRPNVTAGDNDSPAVSQPTEVLKQEIPEAMPENQYSFPSSVPGYTYESAQQLNNSFAHPQASSQMQNLAPFSSVMEYTNSLPSTLLASTVQTARGPDLQYLPFPVTQSMPTKYSNTASSITGPTMSMPEAFRASNISAPQLTPQTMPGTSVATGPALPPHLAVHPYSQPTVPLGHFANMIGYPFLPQSYTYLPSTFQQAFAGNSTYHQSLAAVLPQYKSSVSVSSLSQTAAVPSGYGFESSTSIPGGNFPLNTPAAPAGNTIGYDDVLGSQYKDSNHLISLQQNDNSAMWVHGPGSRTMSAVPASAYYSFQGQNQQPGGFRQGQQPSQHFGALGYPNLYHSQTGMSLEHQQQNPRDASALSGSQAQPSKQTQQLWQNSY